MDDSIRLYKAFIDGLVEMRESVLATRIRSGIWHCEPPPEQVKYNHVLSELSPAQRELIAEIVQEAADSAIHDVLVLMTDNGFELAKDKIRLAIEPFDTESYFDFTARCAGDPWPDEA